jgi:hypothetical protein
VIRRDIGVPVLVSDPPDLGAFVVMDLDDLRPFAALSLRVVPIVSSPSRTFSQFSHPRFERIIQSTVSQQMT